MKQADVGVLEPPVEVFKIAVAVERVALDIKHSVLRVIGENLCKDNHEHVGGLRDVRLAMRTCSIFLRVASLNLSILLNARSRYL